MKVELCAASLMAIEAAKQYGVDRIELCQNLEFGGTSPSFALVEKALDLGLETHILVRPRLGGFMYDEREKDLILNEIELYNQYEVAGFVVGAYDAHYNLEPSFLSKMREKIGTKVATFHRAFDSVQDWQKSMELLIELGYHRILTSGLSTSVDLGMNKLIEMRHFANNRIEIMTGGGVNENNLKNIWLDVRPHAIHFSATSMMEDEDKAHFSAPRLEINSSKLASWMSEINGLRSL